MEVATELSKLNSAAIKKTEGEEVLCYSSGDMGDPGGQSVMRHKPRTEAQLQYILLHMWNLNKLISKER